MDKKKFTYFWPNRGNELAHSCLKNDNHFNFNKVKNVCFIRLNFLYADGKTIDL